MISCVLAGAELRLDSGRAGGPQADGGSCPFCDHEHHARHTRSAVVRTIDLGSLAGSPWAAGSDSAAAISASRPATACRYRYDAAGEACPSLPLRRRVGTVAVGYLNRDAST